MIRELHRFFATCDHPGCDTKYADSAAVSRQLLRQFAEIDGWLIGLNWCYCPKHAAEHCDEND